MTDSLGRVQILDTAAAAVVRILKGYRDARCAWVLLPSSSAAPNQPSSSSTPQTSNLEGASPHTSLSELPQASAVQQQPSIEADGVETKTRASLGDNDSDASSQDSFASARDASLAPMETDEGRADEKHISSSAESREAQPSGSPPCLTAQSRARETVSPRAPNKPGRRSGAYLTAEQRLLLAVHAPRRGVVDVWQTVHGPRLCSIRAGPRCCLLTVPPLLGVGNAAGVAAADVRAESYLFNCVTGQLESLTEAVASALRIIEPRLV